MTSGKLRGPWQRLMPDDGNWPLWLLVPGAVALECIQPRTPHQLLQLVDWPTLGALAGLLVVTKGVETSGVLQRAAWRLLEHVHDIRTLALLLVALSAVLASVLTNDVSLFLIVPLTASLSRLAQLPLARLVTFEALAVNAGSTLTPIGNPQNLFLWESSGIGFPHFVAMMAPVAAIMLVFLLLFAALSFPDRPLAPHSGMAQAPVRPGQLVMSTLLFVVFVALLAMHLVVPGLALVLCVYFFAGRDVLLRTDWMLLVIIGLMFVDLRQIAALPALAGLLRQLPIAEGAGAYLAGVAVSQAVSNVPATILLHPYVTDLPALAAGVNIGGFGLLIGSLANIIALRLARQRGQFWLFHRISVPFLLVVGAAVLLLHCG